MGSLPKWPMVTMKKLNIFAWKYAYTIGHFVFKQVFCITKAQLEMSKSQGIFLWAIWSMFCVFTIVVQVSTPSYWTTAKCHSYVYCDLKKKTVLHENMHTELFILCLVCNIYIINENYKQCHLIIFDRVVFLCGIAHT